MASSTSPASVSLSRISKTRSAAPTAFCTVLLTLINRFSGEYISKIAARIENNSPFVISSAATRFKPYQRTAATPKEVIISITGAEAAE